MGNITAEERARRLAQAGNPSAENTALEADTSQSNPMQEYEAAMAHFDPEDPTKREPVDPTDDNIVWVRVLPKGAGKISKGVYDKQTNSFPFHAKGDRLQLHRSIAQAQEDNGYVEIVTDE